MTLRKSSFRLLASLALCALPVVATAQTPPQSQAPLGGDEKAFFDQNIAQLVKVAPNKMSDPALTAVFAVPMYAVTVSVYSGGGVGNQSLVMTRLGSQLLTVDYPNSDDPSPMIQKFLNPAFRLKADTDAIVMARALDLAYPIVMDTERQAATFKHVGSQWFFVRNHFMGAPTGFAFTTDRTGAITSVKYALKLPMP
jgi:hypothetical protein